MKVFLHQKAARFLEKLDNQIKDRIKEKIKQLEKNPKKGKLLRYSNFRSLRIGNYRVIYEISENRVIVLFIGHRKNVYDDFSRLFLFSIL